MGIFGKSRSQKENETAIKNMLAIMLADGKIDPNEQKMLFMMCSKYGINEKQLTEIMKKPQNIKFTAAKEPNARMQQLVDMIWMMLADGQIDQREMDLCITLATQLGFRPSHVTALVQHIIKEIQRNRETQQVNVNIEDWLDE